MVIGQQVNVILESCRNHVRHNVWEGDKLRVNCRSTVTDSNSMKARLDEAIGKARAYFLQEGSEVEARLPGSDSRSILCRVLSYDQRRGKVLLLPAELPPTEVDVKNVNCPSIILVNAPGECRDYNLIKFLTLCVLGIQVSATNLCSLRTPA